MAKYGNETQKARYAARVDLLTPIVKSWLTDLANEVTSTGVQVFGGMGYIEETGAAQHMRDARILAIYEGTNGIQANDLLFRKLARDGGAAFQEFINEIEVLLQDLENEGSDIFKLMRDHLLGALSALISSSTWLLQNVKTNPTLAAASASPFLRLCGNAFGGAYLIRSALIAHQDLAAKRGDTEFLQNKINSARFYAAHTLPLCAALSASVLEGARTLDGLESGP